MTDEELAKLLGAHRAEQHETSMGRVAATLREYGAALERAGFTRREAMALVLDYHRWMLRQADK